MGLDLKRCPSVRQGIRAAVNIFTNEYSRDMVAKDNKLLYKT